jgi:uracil-DNA glycosylase family 4
VATFGPHDARLLIVGLAPGLMGANRTGRPFTGDYAGILLYQTMLRFGFASGGYDARPDDGLVLIDAAITNGVRCVPPENKPLPVEIATCRQFLSSTVTAMPRVKAILALGRIAHDTTVTALGARRAAAPFAHGARHDVAGCALFDSFHCSRYNTNTGRLTEGMFESVFAAIRAFLDTPPEDALSGERAPA